MLEHGNMMLRHSASAQDGPKHEANHSSGRSASCLCCRHEDGKQQHAKVRCGVMVIAGMGRHATRSCGGGGEADELQRAPVEVVVVRLASEHLHPAQVANSLVG